MATLMNVTVLTIQHSHNSAALRFRCKTFAIKTCPWTTTELDYYTQRCAYFQDATKPLFDNYMQRVYPPIMAAIGLILHPLTYIILLRPPFRTSTFLYLRIIALIEFLYSFLIMFWFYCKTSSIHDGNFCRTVCNVIDWGPVSFLKLFATTLSLFLAFERLVAIVFPKLFPNVSTKKFVLFACLCSISAGFFSMTQLFNDRYVWTYQNSTNQWTLDPIDSPFASQRVYDIYISPIILAILSLEAILIVGFNLCSALGLRRRHQRVATMVGEESQKRDLKQMKRLWRFQAVDAFVMFIDLLCQMCMNYHEQSYFSNINCNFQEQVKNLWTSEITTWLGYVNNGGKYGNHFSIFFLYVIFNPMFRQELKKMIKEIFELLRIKDKVSSINLNGQAGVNRNLATPRMNP